LTAEFAAGTLPNPLSWKEVMPSFIIGIMAVDENGNSAAEGSLDPNCPVFVRLNLEFPNASWNDAQCAGSNLLGKKHSSLNVTLCTSL